jgi:epoxyqueuosine reductase
MTAALEQLAGWMRDESGDGIECRTCVDAGPVQERIYAQYAGLGWIGKNTCLINPDAGSWLLLGAVITSAALEPDAPGFDRCGTCTLCLEACPTQAFVEPWTLDATRCLSYLTIELKGAIPPDLRPGLGTHVFGCDVCQEVCPWNQAAPLSVHAEYQPRPAFDRPAILDLWRRSDAELDEAMRGSATARTRLRGMRRNLAVALGNTPGEEVAAALAESAERSRSDAPSLGDPMVAEHIDWALARQRR